MRKWGISLLSLVVFLAIAIAGYCIDWNYYSVLSGYMVENELADKDDYEIIPIFLAVGKDISDKVNIPGSLYFELEGFLNPVIGPETNVEFGLSFGLRWVPFTMGRFSPYIKGGTGPGYTTQHTHEQATQWNFFSFAGVGAEWKLDANKSLLVEFRYRHFSNAGIDKPNKGVNHHGVVVGLKIKF